MPIVYLDISPPTYWISIYRYCAVHVLIELDNMNPLRPICYLKVDINQV